ncbi:PucR family transcriptional regulator [Aeromicrobium chenweiae]|uniref:Uncharacterized protein n=1 Tax=Aeromicrobium chenweiae TaxID=2079793 RepID=A0A2S0WRZ2_9ACTN|nr:helix-turn-helix domain-containing protein [Aeromicrobium chenweiae]AWB94106.1 hypothetical protein C3E78_08310 [Aeromicrobium chenweiae]TGN31514.1 PucR family transcriptional regulator [Aeromicrobium chenweiae]
MKHHYRNDSVAVKPFLDWLEKNSEELVDMMLEAVVTATPGVVLGGLADHTRLRDALTSHLPLVHSVVAAGDEDPTFELPKAATKWARHMATERVELSELVLAYDAAGDVLIQMFARSTRTGDSRLPDEFRADALEIALERLFRYLRAALTRAISAYTQERELLRHRDDSRVQDVVQSVLNGTANEAEAERELSYRFTATHLAFVVWSEHAVGPELERVVLLLRAALQPWQHLSVFEGHRQIAGWMSTTHPDPASELSGADLPDGFRVALGTAHQGLSGFRSTRREAAEARRMADLVAGSSAVVSFLDVAVPAMASHDTDLVRTFVTGRLGPLLDHRHEVLLQTLQVWFAELGSPTRTSRRLGVHANTVVKRLDRVERLLKHPFDPASLTLRVAVELAPLVVAPPAAVRTDPA